MKPSSCSGCPLESHGQDFSLPEGLGRLGVLVCAEASGEAEARDQLPLRSYAPSGGIYERTLRRLGLDRDQMITTNCIRCRPKDNLLEGMWFEDQALAHCKPNFLAVLQKHKPRVLVALGNVALKYLTGWHGEKQTISHLRGYVLQAKPEFCQATGNPELCVIPTYHPAFLRRGAIHLSGVIARDIMRAVRVSQGKDRSFILDPPEMPDNWAYDSVTNPDPWDEGYEETAKRIEEAKRAHLANWMQTHGLRYTLAPTPRDLDLFCRDVKARSDAWLALSADARQASYLALSADIETRESASLDEDATDGFTDTIVEQIQFSIEPSQGIALSWDEDSQQAASWLLRLPLPKVGHNWWLFDQKVLRAVGARQTRPQRFLASGDCFDTLQMFHYWQPDLPAHLQAAATFCQFPFPWKHLAGSNLPFYGCVDTDATLRVYLTARRTMEDRGIWVDPSADRDNAGYVSQVQRLRPILADMEDRGLPVDNLRRLALDKEFDAAAAEVFAELDARFPEDARRTTPREKGKLKGYADIPTDVKAILERLSATNLPVFSEHVIGIDKAGKEKTEVRDAQGEKVTKKFRDETLRRLLRARWDNITDEEMTAIRSARFQEPPDKDDYEGELTRKVNAEGNTVFVDSTGEEIPSAVFYYDKRPVEDLGDKWARVYEFSPNSSQQLMRYMETKKHKVPVKKGGARTTEKKELERLAAKHHDNFYFKVIEFRELTKMRGTYIDGFRPHADGRVHTTFTFDTATGQLSSRNPNCFSADTDVLTMRGWVPFPDLEETDRVAEWKMDLLTNKARVRFSYPTAYMDQPFEGHLQHIYTDEQIDIMATGDHRCLLQHRKTQQIREFYASEYPEDYRQISAGVYGGGTISLRESQIALICALQADGHVHAARLDEQGRHRGEGGHYSIDLAKKRKIKRLRWALEKEGIPYNQKYRPAARDRKEQARHYISRNNIPEWWRDKKFFGDWILWLDRHSLDLLEREIWFWDGCASRDSMYSSSERINTNWAQIITILSNRRGKIRLYPGVGKRRDNWQVDAVNYSYSMTTNRHNEQVAYKGRVYCVSMPWGSIVVRRNGKVAFTGQCQNVPKHGRLADAFRAIIRHPTKLVVEWDYKSFHVLTTGFEAKDADYMRLARIDMHSFNAWHFMKLPGADKLFSLSDDELREKLEWFKSDKDRKYVRDKKAKAAGLGIGFGLGDEKLYLMNLESFESLAEAKKMKAMIKGLFPRVFRWQDEIRELAHRQTFLKSRYGSIRWFYEVKVPDGKGGMRSGEQSEEAIAFLPANSAFGHIRTVMRELDRNGMASRWEMVNTVHDSLIFLVPPDQLEEHVADIYPVMTAPSKVLIDPVLAPGGLSVDVEASAGVSWAKADLKEVKINLPSLPSLPQLVS